MRGAGAVDKVLELYDNSDINMRYWKDKHGTDYMEWRQCDGPTDVLYQSGQRTKALIRYLLNSTNPDMFNSPLGGSPGA